MTYQIPNREEEMKVVFKKNKILYGQDFRFFIGIPTDVVFEVSRIGSFYKLTSKGYGKKEDYGNGSLLVKTNHWNTKKYIRVG